MLDFFLTKALITLEKRRHEDEEWSSLPVAPHVRHASMGIATLARLGDLLIRAGNGLKSRFEVHGPKTTSIAHP